MDMDSERPVLVQCSSDLMQHGPDVLPQGGFTQNRKCASLYHTHSLRPVAGCVKPCHSHRGSMPSFDEKLVRAIRRKREAEGLSIRALSAAIGVSFSTLARIERGEGLQITTPKFDLWSGLVLMPKTPGSGSIKSHSCTSEQARTFVR
ncbi:helix-turn-helix domain-containing protein [Bradyrhizobium sp. USDA 326]|uniref:helix-turn-helix domain-containing protein n=1 Tax=Bradyrhizobium sp. USDA 326 TaxID=3377726 RepID=UPI003C736F82